MESMSEIMKLGAAGSPYKGISWDYKGHSQIYQIFISYGMDNICGLRFQYLDNEGSLVLSDPLGNISAGSNFKAIKLDYPSEYITWVKVKNLSTRISWLAFETNLGNLHGPFPPTSLVYPKRVPNDVNDVLSTEFDLGDDNQFGGFYGTFDGSDIRSLGIYLKPNSSMKTTPAFVRTVPNSKARK